MSDEKRSEDELDDTAKTPEVPAAAASPAPADARAEESTAEESTAEAEPEDAANPAVIARRVAALGSEDATEALAREEERKLAERRAARKGKKKGGLEVAASKKLSKIGTRAEPKRTVAVAADADPLIERTAKLSEWAKKNQKIVQIVGLVMVAGLLGVAGFLYFDNKRELEASQSLTKAVEAQTARIGDPPKGEDEEDAKVLSFKTFDERRAAALKQYKEVQSKFPSTGAAMLARLAEASILLDKREADAALTAFTEVKGSALATADIEVKGRALEGIGFAHELKALATPAEKDKHLDAALAAYRELENVADVKGFKELAMYHQARVLQNKGEKDKAKEILLSLKQRLDKTEDPLAPGLPPTPTYPYLKEVAMDRLHEIDPESAPKATAPKGGPGGGQMPTQAQIKKMMEDMQKKGQGGH